MITPGYNHPHSFSIRPSSFKHQLFRVKRCRNHPQPRFSVSFFPMGVVGRSTLPRPYARFYQLSIVVHYISVFFSALCNPLSRDIDYSIPPSTNTIPNRISPNSCMWLPRPSRVSTVLQGMFSEHILVLFSFDPWFDPPPTYPQRFLVLASWLR